VDRSPLIAAMLAHAVPGLRVASAGTHAVVGAPAAALMVAVLAEAVLAGRGLAAGGHTARQLTAGMVRDARLVLTATRAHRTYVVQLDASAADSAFTVKELARLVAAAGLPPGAGLHAVLAGAVARLAHDPGDGYGDDDLAGPVGLRSRPMSGARERASWRWRRWCWPWRPGWPRPTAGSRARGLGDCLRDMRP